MGTGLLLKEILREKGMTIKSLAQESGISVNTLYSITKRDSNNVDPIVLKKIAATLCCSPRDLVQPARAAQYDIGYSVGFSDGSDAEAWQNHVIDELWKQEGYSFSERENDLISAFSKMNVDGQLQAVHLIQILSEVPKYQRQPEEGEESAVDPQEND